MSNRYLKRFVMVNWYSTNTVPRPLF